jgi:hypothetical protein
VLAGSKMAKKKMAKSVTETQSKAVKLSGENRKSENIEKIIMRENGQLINERRIWRYNGEKSMSGINVEMKWRNINISVIMSAVMKSQ